MERVHPLIRFNQSQYLAHFMATQLAIVRLLPRMRAPSAHISGGFIW